VVRQVLSLSLVTLVGAHALYFAFSGLSYYFIFNHEMMKHPRFLENQIRQEIMFSLKSMPVMSLLTVPWFLGEVMGYSKLYDSVDEYGWPYLIFSVMA
jgi:lathosterol oxidase